MADKPTPVTPFPPSAKPVDGAYILRLQARIAELARQLAAAGGRVVQPEHTFVLSEGARQELVTQGVTNVDGVRRTASEVRDMLGEGQADVDLGDAKPVDGLGVGPVQERAAIRGFDFVYPSVKPGFIDPAVAGTPGINGPAAKE